MKNVPNIITVSRIVMIFLFLVLANFDATNSNCIKVSPCTAYVLHCISLVIALIAGISDLVDGYLARKYHAESDFGRLFDPLADKIFILATFAMMVDYRLMPAWILIVILTREFMVTGLRSIASAKGVIIPAGKWGKAKTATQMIVLAIGGASWIKLFGFSVDAPPMSQIWYVLLLAVAVITIVSGLLYFIKYRRCFL